MIILDTHALIWWINDPEKLPKKALSRINQATRKDFVLISSISVWEIYMLVSKKRLSFSTDTEMWLATIEKLPFVQFAPVDNRIAAKSVTLPGAFHADPADRMIVATAREKGIPLVTGDERIRAYPHIQTIW